MTLESISINWPAALTAVKTKQSVLDTLASALEAALASGLLGQPIGSDEPIGSDPASVNNEQPGADPMGELPSGAFMGKSLRSAIRLFFSVNKRKLTSAQIVAALKEGGAESTATDFEAVVSATLNQLKTNGEILKFSDGWAFAEHFSESYRKRLAEGQKKTLKKKQKPVAEKKRVAVMKKSAGSTGKAKPAAEKQSVLVPDELGVAKVQ
jgi:hypothetical protein